MISRNHRFHGRASLNYVHKKGQVARGQQVSLKYIVNNRRRAYRLAVVVSRKVSKSAVVRNRIRRRLYEIVRRRSSDLNAVYDLVLMVYDEQLATAEPAELERTVNQLFKKAGVVK